MKQGIIYKYTSPSGKVYIGQTIQEKVRKYQHYKYTSKTNVKFAKAINKYGIENFIYEELFVTIYTDNLDKLKRVLDKMEVAYIEYYNSYKSGYNSTLGGGGILGFTHSEETKNNISKKHIGKTFTEESKLKMSISATGRRHTEESKKKMSEKFGTIVYQLDLDGNFIKKWHSAREAERELKMYSGGISKVCNGKLKTAGGYIWTYKL